MKMTFAEQLQAIKDGKTVKQAMEEAALAMKKAQARNKGRKDAAAQFVAETPKE